MVLPLSQSRSVIKVCPNGLTTRRVYSGHLKSTYKKSSLSVRGDITYFSRHSSLRLRRALCELSHNDIDNGSSVSLGLTLTLPWLLSDDFDSDKLHSDYKIAFNRFSVSFRRRFPNSAAIFRHELQKRGAPHCHIVWFLSDLDFHFVRRGRSSNLGDLRSIVFSFWLKALEGFDYPVTLVSSSGRLPPFWRRGVRVDVLSDNIAMYRYLADHQSKKKLCQLGYKGKQWGYINRKIFVPAASSEISFSDDSTRLLWWRHLSKVCRYTVADRHSVFGSRLSRRSDGRSVYFVPRVTSERLFYALAYGRISPGFSKSHFLKVVSRLLWLSVFYNL